MNRIVASKHFLRPLHVSRVLSVMRQTDSSIVWVNFAARNPMFQYNERMSRKLFVGMVRRRSSLCFLERKRSEIAQCILPVKSRFAPKTQPPSKLPRAWHGTLVRPLFLPSSNLWMGFFSRRGYVTCMPRLTCPEFRISEERAQEEEYLLRHPWTGSRLRAPRGITSEMLSEPERVVREDGEPRLLPTIRAAKSNLKTAKQSLLFEQRSEGKTLPYLTKNLVYKNPPKEVKELEEAPTDSELQSQPDQATQSSPKNLSFEREFLKVHLGDLLPATDCPMPILGIGYHRDGPTRRLLNEGMIQQVRAKVPEITPIPSLDLKRCRTYIIEPQTRKKVHFAVDEFRKNPDSVDPKDTRTEASHSAAPSQSTNPERQGKLSPEFKSRIPIRIENYSRSEASGSAAPVQSRKPERQAKPSSESIFSGIKDSSHLANYSRREASHSVVRKDTRTCPVKPNPPKPKPIVPNSLLRTKTAPEEAPEQPKKESWLRVPVAVMEFVREQELAAMKTRGEEVKLPWHASRVPIRKPPEEPVESMNRRPISRWSRPRQESRPAAKEEELKKERPVRVPLAVKDFITQHNQVTRNTTRTWYMCDLRPSSDSASGEAKAQNETKTPVRRVGPPPPPVRRPAPPPPVRRPAPPPPVRQAAPPPPVRRAAPPPSRQSSVVPPKRKPQAKVPEEKTCRWKY